MDPAPSSPYTRLKEIAFSLQYLDPTDAAFVHVENLFFESLSISRENPGDFRTARLYSELILLKENEYKRTQEYYKRVKEKEVKIRQFKNKFRMALSKCISKR